MLGVYIGVFWPAESIPGVYFTLGWLVFGIMSQNLFFWTQKAQKIPHLQRSKLCHFSCLQWGFSDLLSQFLVLILLYMVIFFRDNWAPNPLSGQKYQLYNANGRRFVIFINPLGYVTSNSYKLMWYTHYTVSKALCLMWSAMISKFLYTYTVCAHFPKTVKFY